MLCPRCNTEQPDAPECRRCGVIIAKARAPRPRVEPEKPPPAPEPPPPVKAPPKAPGPFGGLSLAQRRTVCESLAQLTRAGIAPVQAVTTLAQSAPLPLRPSLDAARLRLEAGDPLSAALESVRGLLGPAEAALLVASEQIGAQDRALAEIAQVFDDRIRLRRRFVASLLYPGVIFLVAILVAPLLESVGELGFMGVAAGGLSATYWGKVLPRLGILAGAVVVLAVAGPWVARQPGVRRALWVLPWPATLYVRAIRGRYARMLGRAIEAGLGFPQATALAVRAADDPMVRAAAEALARPDQPSLLAGLEAARLVDAGDRMAIAAAERAGTLDEALRAVATRQAEAVQRGLGHLTLAIAGLALVLAGILATRTVSQGHAMIEDQTDKLMKELEKELPPGFTF